MKYILLGCGIIDWVVACTQKGIEGELGFLSGTVMISAFVICHYLEKISNKMKG
jgi:hypothetical protein